MGQTLHLLFDLLVIAWRQSKFGRDDDSPCLLNLRMTVAKSQLFRRQGFNFPFLGQDLTRYKDMSNLSPISSSIHKDSPTDTAWNATSKLEAFQTMVQGHMGGVDEFSTCLCFDHITIHTDVTQAIKHNDKSRNAPIADNDIGCIAQDHPWNLLLVGKLNDAF